MTQSRASGWRRGSSLAVVLGLVTMLLLPAVQASAATPPPVPPPDRAPGSLKTVPTPQPTNLNQFLRGDSKGKVTAQAMTAAIALGKALFWDQAVGSDGQACASCHFNAGADSRTTNAVDPGFRAVPQDTTFSAPFAPRYTLKGSDFPLTKFNNQDDNTSGVVSDTNDIISSQGVHTGLFGDIAPLTACPPDVNLSVVICDKGSVNNADPVFGSARRVEPRNTPSVINAIFNYRNFWDGRARNEFNGVDPIGDLDPYARVLMSTNTNTVQKVRLAGSLGLNHASLASQATGPALSDMEMSYSNRIFPKLGKKLLGLSVPLPGQLVALDDSVLGGYSRAPLPGLRTTYASLIQTAFQPQWWNSSLFIQIASQQPDSDGTIKLTMSKTKATGSTDQYTLMEFNFSLFWGLAIQMYEATLRSDDTPFDQAFDSGNPQTFTSPTWGDAQKQGWLVFSGQGLCLACHGGPELTNASVANVETFQMERMLMGNGNTDVYDEGFYNTAVRQCPDVDHTCDDQGIGTTIGPLNLPLSLSRFYQLVEQGGPAIQTVCATDPAICVQPPVGGISSATIFPNDPIAVGGAFKTPSLRNIALTAPYFHNGGELTLMDIVNNYDRGSNFPTQNSNYLDPEILPLNLSDTQKTNLVAFLNALTDARVQFQRAPFDHPQLFVPDLPGGVLPAVGKGGSAVPLNTFMQNLAP